MTCHEDPCNFRRGTDTCSICGDIRQTMTNESTRATTAPDDEFRKRGLNPVFHGEPAPVARELLTLAEVWSAIDGNPGHLPSDRKEVLETLTIIAQAADECDDKHGSGVARELDVEAERRAFEAEYRKLLRNPDVQRFDTNTDGDYVGAILFSAWRMWQASAARNRATVESAPASAAPPRAT